MDGILGGHGKEGWAYEEQSMDLGFSRLTLERSHVEFLLHSIMILAFAESNSVTATHR